ncbi:ATP-binding protein [Ralstonia solanacearum]|uniref:AlbA family DNA-binding domain-containing protein n=1 Tax=Ralstonia solanacearum species complex TaxID=3116862 RepID=UPI000578AA34|nr:MULTISPECIES: ATP-binding protein [Ralstonia solanacearum species complex]AMP36246.1 hypothetical protein LBM2029_01230 [Ralstonia solanacearum]MCK4141828.1 ATP-binding protein [Ralstonia pseudosolanacearum]QKL50617.1 ATP-binding protein [Ralstonia solanacearum]QKL69949.1 ATP-binding protein [Ralstonia solanacearum]QKL75161.1 ATP-binding protein [Ralstonia solanacearum]
MFTCPITEITEADIQALISGRQEEGPTVDFKEKLPGNDSDAKKEFAADVCAFANTSGGYIIYGLAETDAAPGVASTVKPITEDRDPAILRLESMIADTIEPKLYGVKTVAVPVPGGWVGVMQVPRSFSSLHRSKRDNHFYVRESRSKRQLDVPAMMSRMSDLLGRADKIEDFFARRYAAIATNTYPLRLKQGPHVVVHILPVRDFLSGEERDLGPLWGVGAFPAMASGMGAGATPCFEGVIHYRPLNERTGECPAASLVFRSGVVEGCAGLDTSASDEGAPQWMRLEAIERHIVDFLQRALPIYAQHIQAPPVFVRAAVIGAAGIPADSLNQEIRFSRYGDPKAIPHTSAVVLPELLVEDPHITAGRLARPALNRLWQAYGYARSFSYQEQGERLCFQGHEI